MIVVGVLVVILVLAGIFGSADDGAETATTAPTSVEGLGDEALTAAELEPAADETKSTGDSVPVADDPTPTGEPESDDAPTGPDAGPVGTRSNPFGFGVVVPVEWSTFGDADGSVWNTSIGVPRDIGADVAAENQFNDPPPEGVLFVGFDVEMTLVSAGKEPLSPGFNLQWELLGGASAAVYDAGTIGDLFGCGVAPNEFDDFSEVFIGGTLSGTVCIPLPAEDLGHPDTRVSLNFGGDRIIFGSND